MLRATETEEAGAAAVDVRVDFEEEKRRRRERRGSKKLRKGRRPGLRLKGYKTAGYHKKGMMKMKEPALVRRCIPDVVGTIRGASQTQAQRGVQQDQLQYAQLTRHVECIDGKGNK